MSFYNHQLALKFRNGKIVNEGTLIVSPTFWTGINNVSFVNGGKFGDQYLQFTGSAGKRTGYAVDCSGDFTATIWIKDFYGSNKGGSASYPQPLIIWSSANNTSNGFGIEGSGIIGIRTVWHINGVQANLNLDSSLYADGGWHFIELIRKDTIGYIFIDGKLIESKEFPFKGTMNYIIGSGSNAGNVCGYSLYDLNFYAGVAVFAGIPEKYLNDVCGKQIILDAFYKDGIIENKAGGNVTVINTNYAADSQGKFDRKAGHFWSGSHGRIFLPTIGLQDFTFAAFVRIPVSANVSGTGTAVLSICNTKDIPESSIWRALSLWAFGRDETHGGKNVSIASNLHENPYGQNQNVQYQISKSNCCILDGNWHHIALLRQNGVFQFLVDGKRQGGITAHQGFYIGSAWLDFGAKAGTSAANEIWMDNAVCAVGEAWSIGALTHYLLEPKRLWRKKEQVYSVENGIWKEETNRWSELTNEEKVALIQNASYEKPTSEMYGFLGTSSMLVSTYCQDPPTVQMMAVPKDQIAFPKGLIDLVDYEGIDQAKVKSTTAGNGICRILVTTDLLEYQTYDFVEGKWKPVDHTDLEAVKVSGIEASKLADISRPAWDALGAEKIGFAYLLSLEETADICAVDELKLQIDMKGRWGKAVYGEEYTYGYVENDTLRVELLADGSYKINYRP